MKRAFRKIIKISGCILPGVLAAAICVGGLLRNEPDYEALRRDIIGEELYPVTETSSASDVSDSTSSLTPESTEVSGEGENSTEFSEQSDEKRADRTSKPERSSRPTETSRPAQSSKPIEISKPADQARRGQIPRRRMYCL